MLEGAALAGTRRTEDGAAALRARGVSACRFDGRGPADGLDELLTGVTCLLTSIPPDTEGDPVLRHHAAAIADAAPVWIGYLSTTGVYGDRAGGWVDETDAPAPVAAAAERRHAAERAWRALGARHGLAVQVFRLAGIYGPARNPLARLRAGAAQRIVKPGHVLCRIHVADIVAALRASIARPSADSVYNLADDEPAPQAEVVAHAARLIGIDPPAPVSWRSPAVSEAARRFFAESRRVSNRRMKEELGVILRFPTYREGLAALIDG